MENFYDFDLNAHFINKDFSKRQRIEKPNKTAIYQIRILSSGDKIKLENEREV